MFPLRFYANRFFAVRYFSNVGGEFATATVTKFLPLLMMD